ncbi:MAG: hypothetical protein ACOX6P_06925 [Candidatus Merdivicinus sp.]|jgi:hypothetical protein
MKEPVLQWIYAGPFTLDVSDRYYDNYIVSACDYADYWNEARSLLPGLEDIREGDPLSLLGKKSDWKHYFVSEADKKITFAGFGTYARLMAVVLHTRFYAEEEGEKNFSFWFTGSAAVYLNHQEIFHHEEVGRCNHSTEFSAFLHAGWNTCEILLLNVHLHCTNSFSLLTESPFLAVPQLLPEIADRDELNRQLFSFYLEKTLLHPGESLKIQSDLPISIQWPLEWIISEISGKDAGAIPQHIQGRLIQNGEKWIAENLPENFEPGSYSIQIQCVLSSGVSVRGPNLSFHAIRFFDEMPDGLTCQQRRGHLLQCLSKSCAGSRRALTAVFHELAKLLCGNNKEFDEDNVIRTIDYINKRYDCSDFALHGVIRLYATYGKSDILSDQLKSAIKQCILNFKYWVDEPGKSMMFTRSENHEILFHSAEYAAGQLFPCDIFPNSGQNGLFHSLKGQILSEQWIREKGRWGFTEWLSNTYYEEDILALLSIYDFGEENSPFRRLAKNLLDFIAVLIACHQHHGVMATTHGRCYEESLMYPETESMSTLNWLLLGEPQKLCDHFSIGAVALCGSSYPVPKGLDELARLPMWTKARMGMFQDRGGDGVNCATYRTNSYMVSGLVESRAGEHGGQVNAGQVLLDGSVPIFVTCFDNKSATTRPSYWGGQYIMPKTAAYKNLLGLIYRIDTVAGYTHCYFPQFSFDEVTSQNGWWFGRKNNAYIAVYSQKPAHMVQEGDCRGREILCLEKENIWILEAGCREENEDFTNFIKQIVSAKILCTDIDLVYDSPSVGQVHLSWENPCTIQGEPIIEKPFPLIENKYLFSEYGSGVIQSPFSPNSLNFNF